MVRYVFFVVVAQAIAWLVFNQLPGRRSSPAPLDHRRGTIIALWPQ
jgi:hypothetical protein